MKKKRNRILLRSVSEKCDRTSLKRSPKFAIEIPGKLWRNLIRNQNLWHFVAKW